MEKPSLKTICDHDLKQVISVSKPSINDAVISLATRLSARSKINAAEVFFGFGGFKSEGFIEEW